MISGVNEIIIARGGGEPPVYNGEVKRLEINAWFDSVGALRNPHGVL